MQDIRLVSSGFVICNDCEVVSSSFLQKTDEPPVKSYKIVQILDTTSIYQVGDRVVVSGEGARIKLRDNPAEYWMFDINAIVGKLTED